MKQEDKELLLKDLCSRLPYNTIVSMAEGEIDFTESKLKWNKKELTFSLLHQIEEEGAWEFVKPYLRLMSDMTEEEEKEINSLLEEIYYFCFKMDELLEEIIMQKTVPCAFIDWLNAHRFDYRGLIPKGLAIEITKGNNPYKIAED